MRPTTIPIYWLHFLYPYLNIKPLSEWKEKEEK